MADPNMPHLSTLALALAPLGVTSGGTLLLFLAVHVAGSIALALGWHTRASAFVAWITHLALISTGSAYIYGLGKILVIALFYCMVMPVGREWSLDARRRGAGGEGRDATLSVLVLRIHMCIIYAAAGLSKAVGEQWWSGDAVWRALSLPQFSMYDTTGLAAYPWILVAAGAGSVIIQSLYPILVWTRFRFAIVVLAELMHLGIAIFLGLWLFSALMLLLNAAAFGESLWASVRSRMDTPRARASRVTVVYDGGCPFCSDYVRYQELKQAVSSVELVDARSDADALARYEIDAADLEDGMVVIVDGKRHMGGDAVHALSRLSQGPGNWWVATVAFFSRTRLVSRVLYPFLKAGRRVALAILGVPRFSKRKSG
jgi:predicted DCC family thiol-disulfide oxidoreductase YuxK